MAAPSAISVAARALRTHLSGAIGVPEGQILIGHPQQSVKDVEGEVNKQFLNLFFYRVDHGAVPVDGSAEDPLLLRLYCLITGLGTKETIGSSSVSAGENDLRLIGGVMKRLHERPLLSLLNESAQELARLQVVLHPMSLDDLNHVWSTQGETPYRLSVGYELALVPLPLAQFGDRSPRVGSVGLSVQSAVQSGLDVASLPAAGLGTPRLTPQVPAIFVDGNAADWTPHLAFFAGGTLQYSLALRSDALPLALMVIALGAPGAQVRLEWEIFDATAPQPNWQVVPANPANVPVSSDTLNPTQTEPPLPGLTRSVSLPINARGQAVLRAVRDYTRPDGVIVQLRSNPLFIAVHVGAAP
jgi:hypothetical protein